MSYEPIDGIDSAERAYLELGLIPPWKRVYADGKDVTDQPDLWPPEVTDPTLLRGRMKGGRRA